MAFRIFVSLIMLAFRIFVPLLMLALVLYFTGVPAPVKECYLTVRGAFTKLALHTLADIIKLCLSSSRKLQDYGKSLCSDEPCLEREDPEVRFPQQAAYFGAGLLRDIGNFLVVQGTSLMSYSFGTGDTIGTIFMWLAVMGA